MELGVVKLEFPLKGSEEDAKKLSDSAKQTTTESKASIPESSSSELSKVRRKRKHTPDHTRSSMRSHSKRQHLYDEESARDCLPYRPSRTYIHGQPYVQVPTKVVGVFGLSTDTRLSAVRRVFEQFGELLDVQLVEDTRTGVMRGFGFVYFKHSADAKYAVDHATNIKINGRKIRLDYSLTSRPHKSTPGIYMGRKQRLNKTNYSNHNGKEHQFNLHYDYYDGHDRPDRHDRQNRIYHLVRSERSSRPDRLCRHVRLSRQDRHDREYKRRH